MRRLILALFVCIAAGCRQDSSTPPPATAMRPQTDDASLRYFQRRLIQEGDDILHSHFGADLSMLGLSGRELQKIPARDAYEQARAQAVRVEDIAMRRKIMLDLFNETD